MTLRLVFDGRVVDCSFTRQAPSIHSFFLCWWFLASSCSSINSQTAPTRGRVRSAGLPALSCHEFSGTLSAQPSSSASCMSLACEISLNQPGQALQEPRLVWTHPQGAAGHLEEPSRVQNTSLLSASVFQAFRPGSGLGCLVSLQLWVAGNQPRGCFVSIAQHWSKRPERTSAVLAAQHPWPPLSGKSSPFASRGIPPMCAAWGVGCQSRCPSFLAKGWAYSPGWVSSPPSLWTGLSLLVLMASLVGGVSLLSNMHLPPPPPVASLLGPVRLSCVSFHFELALSLGMKPFTAQGKQSSISVAYNHRNLTASECQSRLCPNSLCDPGQGGPFLASVSPPAPLSWPPMLTSTTPRLPWLLQLTSSAVSAVMDHLRPSLLDPGVSGGVFREGGKTVVVESLVLPPPYVEP